MFSTKPTRLVFTKSSTKKSLLTRGGCDPINIGLSMFSEFEEIQMKDYEVSKNTVSTHSFSRYTEATFRI